MDRGRTRGQPAASAAVRAMIDGGTAPHAVLLVGAAATGKTTLALDLAAGLLCTAEAASDRPCGACRGCRMVASGNHPDLHRLAPEGPGGQIRIGERTNASPGTVRRLVADLALLPVEGGRRIAVVEHADRMNEDAQSALLKTLEEPPAGVTIVMCADEEERLLPTVRSRCARLRLGPVGAADVEALLAERGAAEPPVAARLARLAAGRPGIALAYASAPDALVVRGRIARTLLDLLDAGPGRRLAVIAELLRDAASLATDLDPAARPARSTRSRARARETGADSSTAPTSAGEDPATDAPTNGSAPDGPTEVAAEAAPGGRAPAVERRRAATLLLEIWRDLARDLAVAGLGDLRLVRDAGLLDDLDAAARGLPAGAAAAFLDRVASTGELLAGNVSPELAIDVLVLAWPRRAAAA